MHSRPFPPMYARSSSSPPIRFACSVTCAFVLALLPSTAGAQDEAVVDALAGVLAVEDARRYESTVLERAARHTEPAVRRHAALAMGRIGDPRAVPRLVELASDADTAVQRDAVFALGLLGDVSALTVLVDLVRNASAAEQTATHGEAVTAIAKIGGDAAVAFIEELLVRGSGVVEAGTPPLAVVQALREAWRLRDDAPVPLLAQLAESQSERVRLGAVYSLSRLRAIGGASALLSATEDESAEIRQLGVRVLTRAYADSAGLDPDGVAGLVVQLLEDGDPGVRVNALRALGTYEDPRYAAAAADRISDPDPNVRVQVLATLGRLGGTRAATILADHADDGVFAVRREALLGLARVDRSVAIRKAAAWILSEDDWRRRAVGAEALGVLGGDTAQAWLEEMVGDLDGRVAATAFGALARRDSVAASRFARDLLAHPDPVVRTLAAGEIQRTVHASELDILVRAYGRAQDDRIPDARIAVVEALGALAAQGRGQRIQVADRLLSEFAACDDYLVRRAAQQHLPEVAQQWGPPFPAETGRDIDDYRDIARRLVLPQQQGGVAPELIIETERGRITVSLFAADAPVTVNTLLELAGQHYFDGGAWHRVVPNFVIQDGDPRGDGWGGPGFAIRDEINRRRYGRGTVGMALSGPDTGGSQFFITHAPQPHLDGTYTVFGQVSDGMDVVDRIVQGDRIRTIRGR
ncbi:MAG: HEAT repeat domain-containing protein [Gemmatimonadota bacterium]|nr:MAG: HEAT repeat domain-containing protein [Gemmatimonadota bacterium]